MAESPVIARATRERHEFQPGGLILGLLVVAVGLLFLVDSQGVVEVDEVVAGAALLAVVAAGSILRTVLRLLTPRDQASTAAGPADAPG